MRSFSFDEAVRQGVRNIQKDAAAAARLYERVSRITGPFEYDGSHADVARQGLRQLGRDVPVDDERKVTALECYLDGLAHAKNGGGGAAGMDAADSFVSRYLNAP